MKHGAMEQVTVDIDHPGHHEASLCVYFHARRTIGKARTDRNDPTVANSDIDLLRYDAITAKDITLRNNQIVRGFSRIGH
jgi:hypothetical protein